jgi:hypothetical protein
MTIAYSHVTLIIGMLKLVEAEADDGWKAPEIKYVVVHRN